MVSNGNASCYSVAPASSYTMSSALPPAFAASNVFINPSNANASTDPIALLEQALRIARCTESPTNARSRSSTSSSVSPSSMPPLLANGAQVILAEPVGEAVSTICTILRDHCRSNATITEEAISACRCLLSDRTRNINPNCGAGGSGGGSGSLTTIANALRFNGVLQSVAAAIHSFSSKSALVLQAMALMTRLLSFTSSATSVSFVKGSGNSSSNAAQVNADHSSSLQAKLPKIGQKHSSRSPVSLLSVPSSSGSGGVDYSISRCLASILHIHIHNENIVCAVLDLLNVLAKTEKAALLLLSGSRGGALLSAIQVVVTKMLSRADATASGIKFLKTCAKYHGTRVSLKKHCGMSSGGNGLIDLLIGVMRVLQTSHSPSRSHFKTFKRAYRTIWLMSQTCLVPLAQDRLLPPSSIYKQTKSKDKKVTIVHPTNNTVVQSDRVIQRSLSRIEREDTFGAGCSCSRGDNTSWFPEDLSWSETMQRPVDIENFECRDLSTPLRTYTWKDCSCDDKVVRMIRGDSNILPPPLLCSHSREISEVVDSSLKDVQQLQNGIHICSSKDNKQNFHSYGNALLSSVMLRLIDRIDSHKLTETNSRDCSVGHDASKISQLHKNVVYDADHGPLMRQLSTDSLQFESRFECGNLRRAVKVNDTEYDLMLSPDINDTSRRSQWFLFTISGAVSGRTYRFNIVNFVKKTSLYTSGLQPLVLSSNESSASTWKYSGLDIVYFPSPYCQQEYKKSSEKSKSVKGRKSGTTSKSIRNRHGRREQDSADKSLLSGQLPAASISLDKSVSECSTTRKGGLYGVSFSLIFDSPGSHYITMCYPYSYTDLQATIRRILKTPNGNYIRRSLLCKTLTGHRCDLLTVTDFDASFEAIEEREYIFISARVHPGETNSSWVMHGIINTLTSETTVAKYLRSKYIFKLCPMLNPDGVINGSTRCSLSGEDLNRQWGTPSKSQHPTVYHAKMLLGQLSSTGKLSLFLDIHGHSREEDFFVYGCDPDTCSNQMSEEEKSQVKKQIRVFPYFLAQINANFSYEKCSYKVQKSKLGTGRVVVNREIGCLCSYTLEISLAGSSATKSHFSQYDLERMGDNVCEAIYKLDINTSPNDGVESFLS